MSEILEEVERFIDQEGVEQIADMCRKDEAGVVALSNAAVIVTPITDENREQLFRLAMSMYLGERCAYCGREYETIEDLEDTVWYGPHEHGRLACASCWNTAHGHPED